MSIAQSEASVRGSFRTLFGGGCLAGLDEGRLLARFLDDRDESAFEQLVARLGPMVLGVCRRLLSDPADVEDAFQATFLVLVRKAGTLRDPEQLAPWLYGVARRVALRARAVNGRRRRRERPGAEDRAIEPEPSCDDRQELRGLIDDELARLPERLRAAIVLCDLQGLPQQEVARRLGCPVGTVKSRLSRARDRLRGRLLRRGVSPASLIGGTLLSIDPASAATLAELQLRTLRLATAVATGTAATTPAVVLMEGVLRSLTMTKLQATAAGLLVLGLTTAGTFTLAVGPPSCPAGPATTAAAPAAADEEKVGLDKVPPAVLKAVKEKFPKAEITGAAKEEEEDDETIYEVSLTENGRKIDVSVEPAGKIVLIEREIDLKDLPAKAADALKAKFAGATPESAEAVEDIEEGENYFEVILKQGELTIEATVAADGAIEAYRKEIDPKDLPKAVADAIRAKYAQGKIEEAAEVLDDEAITYEVGVEVGEADRLLTVDPQGEIVEDEEMEDEDEDDEGDFTTAFAVDEAELIPTGRNPFFVLEPGFVLAFEGKEDGQPVTLTITVLDQTKKIGNVTTRVVEERETKGGQVIEVSRNFFAICKRTNNVYYFGEEVDMYKDGKVVSHEGAWLHGEGGAKFGLAMPGSPLLGARYYQEQAPGKAMDRAEVVSMSEELQTPAGLFKNVLKIEETTPLEKGEVEAKLYAAGVGLIRDGAMLLTKYGKR